MRSHLAPRDFALTLAVVALWGFAFVPIKWALADVPPFMLAAMRFLFAALPAVFFVARPAMPWRPVAAYGVAIGVLQFGLLFLGMHLGMPAGLSSLVIQLQVFFTIALSMWLFHERPRAVTWVGRPSTSRGMTFTGPRTEMATTSSNLVAGKIALPLAEQGEGGKAYGLFQSFGC